MNRLIEIKSPEDAGRYAAPDLPPFDARTLVQHAPDAHWIALGGDGRVHARASLWWQNTAPYPPHRPGVIGHFAATDRDAAVEVLEHACAGLRERDCSLAVGPMDGNTWRRYRLLTERGSEPTFFLEPDNPDDWPRWFAEAKFQPLATYFSALNDDLSMEDPRIPRAAERLERAGVRLRPINPADFTGELRRIYEISRVSFADNFLYTPIAEADFLAQYESIRSHLRPELVLLAEQENRPVGFIFGVPDLAQAKRGAPMDTVILKTVATLPGRAWAGLGNVLVARCQQAARALGFRRVIHALMHESNNSLNLSGHYAKPFRRYTLFARQLESPT